MSQAEHALADPDQEWLEFQAVAVEHAQAGGSTVTRTIEYEDGSSLTMWASAAEPELHTETTSAKEAAE